MNDISKWVIGLSITACVQIGAASYLQGGVNSQVKTLATEFSQFKNEFATMKVKFYTIDTTTNSSAIVLNRVDKKLSKVESVVMDHGQRIAVLEWKSGGKQTNGND